ncbi:hypothetical protein ACE193_09205 [Bernardetia sp. OM2101]|uniref:hypothetical protein n=1 Tax=Bernardetia sp. OM2101 TaxID=3344876 RepID=UPI0035CFBA9E
MKSNLILFFFIFLFFFSCKNEDVETESQSKEVKRDFPKVKKLSEYPKTEFLPTLENKISKDKNAVYCVTLLYAWDEVRKAIKTPLQIQSTENSKDLILLNNSTSFKNVLNDDEYISFGGIKKADEEFLFGRIIARAEFNKSLPFELDLNSFDNELIFKGIKVASFGTFGGGKDTYKTIKILYYKNDNEFVIKLLPKDKQHEILLFKTKKQFKNFAQMNNELEKKKSLGKKERKQESKSWKYYLQDEDEVIIPKFNFNIETNYSNIEGNTITSSNKDYLIELVYQRTAFIFDEKGAKLESEAEIMVAIEDLMEEEKPKPKKMRFDKPFFVLLKKVEATNPYFVLFANNTELMVKE